MQPDQHTPKEQLKIHDYQLRLLEAQAEADKLRADLQTEVDRSVQAEQALQRAVGALGDLVQFAQQAHTDWSADGVVFPGTMKRLCIAAKRGASIPSRHRHQAGAAGMSDRFDTLLVLSCGALIGFVIGLAVGGSP